VCTICTVSNLCSTTCRCSNYVRTGRVDRPDGLLCLLNQICLRETAQRLSRPLVSLGQSRYQEEHHERAFSP